MMLRLLLRAVNESSAKHTGGEDSSSSTVEGFETDNSNLLTPERRADKALEGSSRKTTRRLSPDSVRYLAFQDESTDSPVFGDREYSKLETIEESFDHSKRRTRPPTSETAFVTSPDLPSVMVPSTASNGIPPGPPSTPNSKGRRKSRARTNSDDIPRMVQGQVDTSDRLPTQPPPQPYYHSAYGLPPPPPPSQGPPQPPVSHHQRTHSWSGGLAFPVGNPPQVPLYPGPQRPAPRPYSNATSPGDSVDGAHNENEPLLRSSFPSERPPVKGSRQGPRKGKHRRALSSSEAMPGNYGALFADPNPSPSSYEETMKNLRGQSFSPRTDFMALTGSLRGSESPRVPQPAAQSPVSVSRKSWAISPRSSLPSTPLGNDSGSMGGEAVFLATKKQRPESQRKRHMRQQSAQLWVEDVKGEVQSPACRDVFFLLLFVFHLVFIVYLGNLYSHDAVRAHPNNSFQGTLNNTAASGADEPVDERLDAAGDPFTIYYDNLMYMALLCGPFAVAFSALLLGAMTLFAKFFVQIALIIVITLSFIWGTVGIGLSPKTAVPVTGIICLALTVAYTFIVWDRIPFASANLVTALSGVHAHPGTIVVAFCFQALALGWSVYYALVVVGVYDGLKTGQISIPGNAHGLVYALMCFSYYWTFQVFQNCVQVATAAIIGGWWYEPENKFIVRQSCFKTFFYYMGSICYGSLFVGPVRVLRQLSGLFRPSSAERTSLMCFHECLHCIQTVISSCIDSIAHNFSPWGFTYVGLYGYSFVDASFNAAVLFDKRGWTVIVSDDLVPNILLITSVVIGGVTGCFANLIWYFEGLHVTSLELPGVASFVAGSVIGVVMTSILFSVISSSVNAVLVCFAASPMEFERNHPKLSHQMRNAWREVWPGALDAIDLRLAMMSAASVGTPASGSTEHSNGMV